MTIWKRGRRRPGYTGTVLEVVELSNGETVAIRSSKFFSDRGVAVPREAWEDFVQAVKNGEFDTLPRKSPR